MDPLVEIVIHDIAGDSITYINGKLSKRKIGEASLLDPEGLNGIDKIVYPKVNFDGRLIKSVSVMLEGRYLLCINCDVSIFNKLQALSSTLLQMAGQPQSLFTNDWQEKLHVSIHSYLQNHHLSFDHLSKMTRKV
ncbi:MAG: PAS domain-containing protein [Gammaproteobacteria bacterium]|nr:PAS domain-containing protein [Gammaproteobacteria bacterium]